MKTTTFIFTLLFLITTNANELKFYKNKIKVQTITINNGFNISGTKLKIIERKLYNVNRQYFKTYIGIDFIKLLDEIYTPEWRNKKVIMFKAKDGYVTSSNISKLIPKLKNHQGILAIKEEGNENGFTSFEKRGKQIELGPFYLVWNGYPKDAKKPPMNDPIKWPYQLSSVIIK